MNGPGELAAGCCCIREDECRAVLATDLDPRGGEVIGIVRLATGFLPAIRLASCSTTVDMVLLNPVSSLWAGRSISEEGIATRRAGLISSSTPSHMAGGRITPCRFLYRPHADCQLRSLMDKGTYHYRWILWWFHHRGPYVSKRDY